MKEKEVWNIHLAIGTKYIFVNSKTMPEQKDIKNGIHNDSIEHFHYERALNCVETETKSLMNQQRKLFDSRFSIECPKSTF